MLPSSNGSPAGILRNLYKRATHQTCLSRIDGEEGSHHFMVSGSCGIHLPSLFFFGGGLTVICDFSGFWAVAWQEAHALMKLSAGLIGVGIIRNSAVDANKTSTHPFKRPFQPQKGRVPPSLIRI